MNVRLGPSALFAFLGVLVLSVHGAHAAAPSGTATASSTLVRLVAGDRTVAIGTDVAESARGTKTSALARLVAGSAGDLSIGFGERTAETRGESGRTDVAKADPQSVDRLLTLEGLKGSVEANVTSVNVSSLVSLALGDSAILGRAASLAGGASTSRTLVNADKSSSTRSITIDRIEILAIGDFLAALGVDPFALACEAVETVGTAVGKEAGAACEQLETAKASIETARSALATARADVAAQKTSLDQQVSGRTRGEVEQDLAAVEATVCDGADLACQASALTGLFGMMASEYGVSIPGLSFADAKAALIAAMNAILGAFDELDQKTAELAALDGDVEKAEAGTCAAVGDAVADASTSVPSAAETLASAGAAVAAACGALSATVEGILDTPLLTMDGATMAISTVATPGGPAAKVTGTIGSIRVGLLEPVGVDLAVAGGKVAGVQSLVEATLADVADAVGINLPAPEFELLVKETDEGRRSDGTYFAEGSVTAVRVHMPATDLEVPASPPLGILDDAQRSIAAVQASPDLTLDVGVFAAASEYDPTGADGGPDGAPDGGRRLPRTGLGLSPLLWLAGATALGGAAAVRRFLAQR